VVEIYYDSDEKVQGDEEIQGFVKDCHIGMQRPHSENRFNFSKAMFTPGQSHLKRMTVNTGLNGV